MKSSHITVSDQFCGAGGSSQAAENVSSKIGGGVEVKLALNHWKLAIETHSTNFPNAIHDCTDISACDPRRYPSTTILLTSPECTNHSLAKGQKAVKAQLKLFEQGKLDPSAERSRATMWDVPRFAEYHKYEIIITENVVDARKWIMWEPWLHAMHALGYEHKCCYFNSMHFWPTPQSRDRMYVVFWKRGNKKPNLNHMPLAFCPKCAKNVHSLQTWKRPDQKWGKYKQQYYFRCPHDGTPVEPYYYASFNCIDWNRKGQRIGDRPNPLASKTTNRIQFGLDKYEDWPFIFHAAYSDQARGVVRDINSAAFTQTTLASQALCVPPFIIKGEHTSQPKGYTKHITEAFQTQTKFQSMGLVVPPFIVENKGQSKTKKIVDPLPCLTTVPHLGIITDNSWQAFIAAYNSTGHCTKHITEALGTQPTNDRFMLVQYQKPKIEDCYYRMIHDSEIQRAMAFRDSYVVLGSAKDKVKQLGNAVTPPPEEFIIEQCIETLR